MTRLFRANVAIVLCLTVAGCGGQVAPKEQAERAPSGSPHDIGPRAAEFPVAPVLAANGEALFKSKGCTACHVHGKRLVGPDLDGVTHRRTAQWMEQQILHPEIMTKEDPISIALLAEYAAKMSNQGLTSIEAQSVIEYLKRMDATRSEREAIRGGRRSVAARTSP